MEKEPVEFEAMPDDFGLERKHEITNEERERFEKVFSIENPKLELLRINNELGIQDFLNMTALNFTLKKFEFNFVSPENKRILKENIPQLYRLLSEDAVIPGDVHDLENVKSHIENGICIYAPYRTRSIFNIRANFTAEELRASREEMKLLWQHGMGGALSHNEAESFENLSLQVPWNEISVPYLDNKGVSFIRWIERDDPRSMRISDERQRAELPEVRIVERYKSTTRGPFHLVEPGPRSSKPTGLELEDKWGMFDVIEGGMPHSEKLRKNSNLLLDYTGNIFNSQYDLVLPKDSYILIRRKDTEN